MFSVILTLSAILAAVLFGGLIPQHLPPEMYLARYGEVLGRPLLALGLDDIFHTKGFSLLGLILFAQLLICTVKRTFLLREGVKIRVAGSVLLHAGCLIFLGSAGVSLWLGSIVTAEAPEGKIVSLAAQKVPFDLRLERFEIDYYPENGSIRQYRSEVTLLREGKEIRRGSLEVNEPLKFGGTKIFQMSYGWFLEGSVLHQPGGARETFSIRNGAWINLPGSEEEKLHVELTADPDKHRTMNPAAAFLVLRKPGDSQSAFLSAGESFTSGTAEIRFDRIRRYSGLQVKQDPGIPGIFGGLALALAGLVLRYLPAGRRKAA